MFFSNAKSLILALAGATVVQAHSTFTTLYVDGVSEGDAVCVRTNKDPAKATFPVEDLTSNDVACGFSGTEGVARVCSVKGTSTLTFQFRDKPNEPNSEAIDPSHKGPCAVYLKKVDNSKTDPGTGDGWFKIWDDGYDEEEGKWCTEKLIANNGYLSVKLPDNLQGGHYLARPELLALHAADKGDPQFYMGCAQIFVESSGNMVPTSTVAIPGYVKPGEKAVSFNIWETPMALPYPIPGPAVANYTAGAATTQKKLTVGLKPKGCILESGNWCGFEVSSYSDEEGCWNANDECWSQDKDCWDNAPVTGGSCKIWETKCNGIEAACKAKNFNGPPSKGKVLTPAHTVLGGDAIDIYPTVGGGNESGATKTSKTSPKASSTKAPASTKKPISTKATSTSTNAPVRASTKTTKKQPTPYSTKKPAASTVRAVATEPTSKPAGIHIATKTVTEIVTATAYETVYAYANGRRNALSL